MLEKVNHIRFEAPFLSEVKLILATVTTPPRISFLKPYYI